MMNREAVKNGKAGIAMIAKYEKGNFTSQAAIWNGAQNAAAS
jgi:hypothetical protein